MNIALIGPSGAGKGTHLITLIERFNFIQVGAGELFRENLESQTALGILAKKYMAQGELVPDELVDAMMEERIRKAPPNRPLLFDGFPRTGYQARFLDDLLGQLKLSLGAVIYLKVPDEEIIHRLSKRVLCRVCHRSFEKSESEMICPEGRCHGEHLYQRADDQPAMAEARLKTFHRTIGPVLDYYQESGRLLVVDGRDAVERVDLALKEAVDAVKRKEMIFSTPEEVARLKPARRTAVLEPSWKEVHPGLNLVLVGAPGSGKGTQAEALTKELGILHIATGDLFRENLKKQTELGVLARSYMQRGELVPDNITEAMVQKRLADPDAQSGFILDGFPRTFPQAQALLEMMAEMGRKLSGVIYIHVSDEEIVQRLSGRLICRNCQSPYHLTFKPPQHAGICDLCGGELYQREDDNPATVRARLKTFHAQTEPMIDLFRREGLLVEVDGEGDIRRISKQTLAAAKSLEAAAQE